MSSAGTFVETQEYRRFQEFCDACRRDRYIGLCYGPPGVGKTLSARRYASWDEVQAYRRYTLHSYTIYNGSGDRPPPTALLRCDTIVYTPSVANTPGQIEQDVSSLRYSLRDPHIALIRQEEEPLLKVAEQKLDQLRRAPRNFALSLHEENATIDRAHAVVNEIRNRLAARERAVKDPTALIVIDEADRLKMAGLEQVRDIFDRSNIGLVLIGMPGIEKRLARYPQLYSRVGFVHEYRPLTATEVRRLLQQHWRPAGVTLPEDGIADEETISSIIRVTGGNFRLLHRLLTQMARVLQINELRKITLPVVEAARESLVIGTA
jgi:DNA transposition AAA+ family ATPase